MSDSESILILHPVPPPKWRRWCVRILVLIVIVAGIAGAAYTYLLYIAEKKLEEAVAEADRLDPGWRCEDLEAGRVQIPEAENAALCVQRVHKLLPEKWQDIETLLALRDIEPQRQLNPRQIALLRIELNPLHAALGEADKVADLSRGRTAITLDRDVLKTMSPHITQTRLVFQLLLDDALLHAQDGDCHAALRRCRAALNCGRSFGDEPSALSQLFRMVMNLRCCHTIERTLAQGNLRAADLADLQRLVEDEAEQPLFRIAARGERAGYHRLMQAIEAGDRSLLKEVMSANELVYGPRGGSKEQLGTLSRRIGIKQDHARGLHYLTQCVALAKLPSRERGQRIKELQETIQGKADGTSAFLIPELAPDLTLIDRNARWNEAILRCAAVALAAERFRLAQGRWPDSLAALVPAQLRQLPTDPCDGKTLRYRRLEDGVVVYSVGLDGKDDGGLLERKNPHREGTDTGIRLWDVPHRRQPPLPEPPIDE